MITVGGGGGLLGPCGVFDTDGADWDHVTLPDGSVHGGSDCPVGILLADGATVGWESNTKVQGGTGTTEHGDHRDNGCAAVGLGLWGSVAFDAPSGPSIVVAALVLFVASLAVPVLRPRR